MRGKVFDRRERSVQLGITPAYAGKRDIPPPGSTAPGDHPRVCGEKSVMTCFCCFLPGSPPRVRGKVRLHGSAVHKLGITPACAGKSSAARRARQPSRDHPRVCGEKTEYRALVTAHQGSPPRVRGKAHDGRQVLRGLRRHLKCDWDGHLRLVQVGNVVHERALMPDVHESQSRRTPQRHNDRMGQPVQAGMHGGSHGCRGRAAAPKCPPPGSERYPFHPLR